MHVAFVRESGGGQGFVHKNFAGWSHVIDYTTTKNKNRGIPAGLLMFQGFGTGQRVSKTTNPFFLWNGTDGNGDRRVH